MLTITCSLHVNRFVAGMFTCFVIKYFDVQVTVSVCYEIVHFEMTSKSKTHCFEMNCTACRWRECHLLKGFWVAGCLLVYYLVLIREILIYFVEIFTECYVFYILRSKFCRQIGLVVLTIMKSVFVQLQFTTRHKFQFGESQN